MLDIATNTDLQKVLFGAGNRKSLLQSVEALGKERVLVVTTPEQSELGFEMADYVNGKAAGVFSCATMHTPVEITEEALDHVRSIEADCLVAVGGGSTIGLSKAIALRTELPQIVIPTTYAGSEATPILGQTEDGVKTTLRDMRVLPEVIIYDAELVATLPKTISATSALNAIAHAVEALYASDRTEETTKLAISGLKAFSAGLKEVIAEPDNLEAREATQRGAWACGTVLGRVGMALHHKLCHTLGGSFDMPHAQTHAVILPHAVAYNEQVAPELLTPVAHAFQGNRAATAIWDFAKSVDSPMSLQELGFEESDIERAAEIASQNPYWNPREITREGLLQLLKNAWAGQRPGYNS